MVDLPDILCVVAGARMCCVVLQVSQWWTYLTYCVLFQVPRCVVYCCRCHGGVGGVRGFLENVRQFILCLRFFVLFLFFEITSCTLIPLFRRRSFHSGLLS